MTRGAQTFLVLFFLATFGRFAAVPVAKANFLDFETAQKRSEREKDYDADLVSYVGQFPTKYGEFAFEIHTPKTHIKFGELVEQILREDGQKVFNYFQYVPRQRTHFITKIERMANGAATVFPTNLIWLNDFPPQADGQLFSDKDWLRALVIHELTHVVHMDQTRGILSFLRFFLGSSGKLGGVVPRWFTEGIAVWMEGQVSPGRLDYQGLRQDFYAQFAKKGFCRFIDCLDDPGMYPFQSLPYLLLPIILS